MTGARRLTLAPSARAARTAAATPGPPKRDPRRPGPELAKAHRLQVERLQAAARLRGHRLDRVTSRRGTYGWAKFTSCTAPGCRVWLVADHRKRSEAWGLFWGGLRWLTASGTDLENLPDCPARGGTG